MQVSSAWHGDSFGFIIKKKICQNGEKINEKVF